MSKSLEEIREIATTWQEVNPTGEEAIKILQDVVSAIDQNIQELKAIKTIAQNRIEELEWENQLRIF